MQQHLGTHPPSRLGRLAEQEFTGLEIHPLQLIPRAGVDCGSVLVVDLKSRQLPFSQIGQRTLPSPLSECRRWPGPQAAARFPTGGAAGSTGDEPRRSPCDHHRVGRWVCIEPTALRPDKCYGYQATGPRRPCSRDGCGHFHRPSRPAWHPCNRRRQSARPFRSHGSDSSGSPAGNRRGSSGFENAVHACAPGRANRSRPSNRSKSRSKLTSRHPLAIATAAR